MNYNLTISRALNRFHDQLFTIKDDWIYRQPNANLQLVGQLGKNCCAGRNKPCCAGRSKACGTSLEPSGQLTVKSIRMLFMRFVYLAVTTSLSFETSFYFIQCIMLGHKSRSTTMLIVC